jgi:diadenosine tetraphosphatase ApaH/serine/threonine PP2A family protein phosphatase
MVGHLNPVKNLMRIIEGHNRERLAVMGIIERNHANIFTSQSLIDEIKERAGVNPGGQMDPADTVDVESHENRI